MKKTNLSTTMTALMLSLAALPLVSDLNAADIFTKITEGPGSGVGNSTGVAWGDYDNDGFIDLFVSQRGPGGVGSASQSLYHNNTNGTFNRVTNGPIAAVFRQGAGTAWGDYDNDGYLDLVLLNANQPNYLFHNNGDGSFAEVPSSVSSDIIADSRSVTWVDYDNDGYVDLFRTAIIDEPRRLYQNNHDGTFTRITQGRFPHRPGRLLRRGMGRLQQRWPARPFPAASQRDERPAQLPLPERRRRHVYSRGRRDGFGWHFQ